MFALTIDETDEIDLVSVLLAESEWDKNEITY